MILRSKPRMLIIPHEKSPRKPLACVIVWGSARCALKRQKGRDKREEQKGRDKREEQKGRDKREEQKGRASSPLFFLGGSPRRPCQRHDETVHWRMKKLAILGPGLLCCFRL
jgi:hypothetical protein